MPDDVWVWEVRSNKIQEKEEEERLVRKREILYLPFDEKQREHIGICDERKMWKHSDNRVSNAASQRSAPVGIQFMRESRRGRRLTPLPSYTPFFLSHSHFLALRHCTDDRWKSQTAVN